jgi:hypothetical protein
MTQWTLAQGTRLTRREPHSEFGGSCQTGISRSASTPNIFLFSYCDSSDRGGYLDGWATDGCLEYSGERDSGRQQHLSAGNRAIFEAASSGHALRLFECGKSFVEYQGEFQLDIDRPWYLAAVLESDGTSMSSRMMFRLRPLRAVGRVAQAAPERPIDRWEPKIVVVSAAIADQLKKRPEGVYGLTPREFEQLVLEILLDRGHEAYLTPATRDGGKDILAYLDSDFVKLLCLVETKRYARHRKVGFGTVQRLYGAFMSHGANCAMLVTTSFFSAPALDFQRQYSCRLALRDYLDLMKWLREYGSH